MTKCADVKWALICIIVLGLVYLRQHYRISKLEAALQVVNDNQAFIVEKFDVGQIKYKLMDDGLTVMLSEDAEQTLLENLRQRNLVNGDR